MTIAACYVSPEGVVLGADSTMTYSLGGAAHYFDHGQKIFEVGKRDSTLGMVLWGLGSVSGGISHRTLIAELGDSLTQIPPVTVQEAANRWCDIFWSLYEKEFADQIKRSDELTAKSQRTVDEQSELAEMDRLTVGFCLGGWCAPDRTPAASVMTFSTYLKQNGPVALPINNWGFWGAPNLLLRVIRGADPDLIADIMKSGKWTGTQAELDALVQSHNLGHPILPLREAIDFVHASIYTVIKAMKFSEKQQICGGPVELAVITTDRPFRWVRHKRMDEALGHGQPRGGSWPAR